jgi:cytochrome oxidase Cu insertion factor (SCO1/SenC/PrrC family)
MPETPKTPPAPARTWAAIPPRETIRRRYFPDVRLVTHQGKTVRLYEDLIRDKTVVLNFFYATCTGICIPVSANLARVQTLLGKRMGHDIFMCSFTLKPVEDTPEVLRRYARSLHARPGWQFLTGAPADLELVRRRLGFADLDPVLDADKTNPDDLAQSILSLASPPGQTRPGRSKTPAPRGGPLAGRDEDVGR